MVETLDMTADLLGDARPPDDELAEMVSTALHREVAVARWVVEPVAYEAGSPATAALLRVRGCTTDGENWSVFLKVLQHPRHWSGLDRVPVHVRAEFTDSFPWRAELAAWDPEFLAALPEGLRVPRLYRQVELPDERVAVWMQDVPVSDERWSVQRFVSAARLLGQLAANRCDAELLAGCGVPAGYGVRKYVDGPVTGAPFALRDTAVWRHPSLDTPLGRQVRGELLELAPQVPAILDLLDGLPQALPHGTPARRTCWYPATSRTAWLPSTSHSSARWPSDRTSPSSSSGWCTRARYRCSSCPRYTPRWLRRSPPGSRPAGDRCDSMTCERPRSATWWCGRPSPRSPSTDWTGHRRRRSRAGSN